MMGHMEISAAESVGLQSAQNIETSESLAPAHSGGSFYLGGVLKPVEPERMVPVEHVLPGVTVPYVFLPNIESRRWDEDHTRFEVSDPRLTGPDRRPLRHCSLQYLPRSVHDRKNDLYDAVDIPTDDHAVFQAVLLGAARYVSRMYVDVSGNRPRIGVMDDSLLDIFHEQKWMRMQRTTAWSTGFYIARYVLKYGLESIKESEEVARFVASQDDVSRKRASFGVLRLATKQVVEPFESTYEIARRQGAIRRHEPTAQRFITRYYDDHQPDYTSVLTQELLGVA